MNEGWDIASQIEQRMEFDGGFGGPKERPGKHGETKVDGGCVKCIDGVVEIEP